MSSGRVKIPTFFGIIWVVVVAVLVVQVERGAGIEESFCVGTGSGNDKANSFGWTPLRTMGWEAAYHRQRSLIWLLNHQRRTYELEYKYSLDLLPVKDLEGNILNGWVHIKVAVGHKNPEIFAMAAWVVNGDNAVIGSFVKADEAVCRGEQTVPGQDLSILPCSATPKNTPANPGMFIFTKQENGKKIRSVSLLWRMSVSMCDMPENVFFKLALNPVEWSEFEPEDDPTADIFSTKYGPGILATTALALKPTFYGAASPVFRDPEGDSGIQLDCSGRYGNWEKVKWSYDGTPGYIFSTPFPRDIAGHWERRAEDDTAKLKKSVMAERATCRAAPEGHSLFGGRCEKPTQGFNYAEEDGLPGCDGSGYSAFKRNAATDIGFQTAGTYKDYMESNRSDLRLYPSVTQVIQEIKHQDQRERALRRHRRHQEQLTTRKMDIRRHHAHRHLRSQIDFWAQDRLLACRSEEYSRNDELGLCLIDPPGKYIYGLRQWHAGAALVCTMFFNPICTYVARYLKGVVFMNRGRRVPARMWYFFHVNMLMPMFCMFATGVPVLRRQTTVYGVSMTNAAFYHRLFGYIVSALPVIQIVTGILRPLELHPWRKVMIYLHWFLGFLFKYGCLALCVTSYLIPGSPSAFISHMRTDEYPLIWKHPLPLIILAAVAVDLLFHSILTLHIYLFDRRNGFQRYGYFPVLFAHVFDDEDRNVNNYQITLLEYNHQKRVFRFYVFLCFFELMVIFNVMFLFTFTDDLHAVGPMTCTHDENGHFYIPPEVSQDEDLLILCPVEI